MTNFSFQYLTHKERSATWQEIMSFFALKKTSSWCRCLGIFNKKSDLKNLSKSDLDSRFEFCVNNCIGASLPISLSSIFENPIFSEILF